MRRRYWRYRPWMLNGRPANINRRVKRTIVRAVNAGLYVTSTTGGRHAYRSWHYPVPGRNRLGRAVDLAGTWDRMVAFQKAEYRRGRGKRGYLELFGPDNQHNLKYGRPLTLAEGSGLERLHDTHVHVARR